MRRKIENKIKTKLLCILSCDPKTTVNIVSPSDYKCMAYIEDILSIIQNFATEIKEDPKPEKIF